MQIAKKEQKLGIRASSTCTLNFDELKVPVENVMGGEGALGKGYKIAIEILNEGASLPIITVHAVHVSYLCSPTRRPNWNCCTDDRIGTRGFRQGSVVCIPTKAIWQGRR